MEQTSDLAAIAALMAVCAALLAASAWLLRRAWRVSDFRCELTRLGWRYAARNPGSMFGDWFAGKHSFHRMLFSRRPLTLREWYSAEEIDEISK